MLSERVLGKKKIGPEGMLDLLERQIEINLGWMKDFKKKGLYKEIETYERAQKTVFRQLRREMGRYDRKTGIFTNVLEDTGSKKR